MKACYLGFLLLVMILGGCANPQQQQRIDQDLAEMKRRLAANETALVELRKAQAAGGGQQQLAGLTRGQADLKADFDSFRNQVLSMQGDIEEQAAARQKLQAELTALRDELRFKVKAIEERLAKLEKAPPKVAATAPPPVSAEELYQQGLDAIRNQNNFALGRERLQAFLKQYPGHHLAVNATYWIGEAWYGEKKYENAILQFQDVVEKYGNQPKVASALLKQGLAFQALGDKDNARVIWAKLQERFPKSPEAKKAAALMKK